jgi:hypothetical protein
LRLGAEGFRVDDPGLSDKALQPLCFGCLTMSRTPPPELIATAGLGRGFSVGLFLRSRRLASVPDVELDCEGGGGLGPLGQGRGQGAALCVRYFTPPRAFKEHLDFGNAWRDVKMLCEDF